jgi:hypothetical protein
VEDRVVKLEVGPEEVELSRICAADDFTALAIEGVGNASWYEPQLVASGTSAAQEADPFGSNHVAAHARPAAVESAMSSRIDVKSN